MGGAAPKRMVIQESVVEVAVLEAAEKKRSEETKGMTSEKVK